MFRRHRLLVLAVLAVPLTLGVLPGDDPGPAHARVVRAPRLHSAGLPTRHVTLEPAALRAIELARRPLWSPPARVAAEAPPIALTDASGQGLRLVRLHSRGVIEGPLAFTELLLAFENPLSREIEGRFQITLPPGAAISRFAMREADGWKEAEVVERKEAQQVYEDFLHRRIDPALLEKQAGNGFQARIFPIPARARKEILISYSEALGPRTPYRVLLRGLPEVAELDVAVQVPALAGMPSPPPALRRTRHRPTADYTFALPADVRTPGLRHGRRVALPVRPPVSDRPVPLGALLVLVDTSASRTLGFGAQVARLGALVSALAAGAPALRLTVTAFDQAVAPVYAGPASAFGEAHLAALRTHGPLGASDLHRALSWAGRQAGHDRVLVLTDAIATAGETDLAVLRGAVARLRPAARRLDVALTGGLRDREAAEQLVRGLLPEDGVVLDEDEPADTWAGRLRRSTRSGVRVTVPGARWSWPRVLDGLQAGDEVLIHAELGADAPEAIDVSLSGGLEGRVRVPLARVAGPLLGRSMAAAELARLRSQLATLAPPQARARAEVRKQMVTLSTRERVLCDLTALLVLDTEADYARFKIDRRALSDVLVVGDRGVEVRHRSAVVTGKAASRPEDAPPAAGPSLRPPAATPPPRPARMARQRDAAPEDALGALVGNPVGDSHGRGDLGMGGGGGGASRGMAVRSGASPGVRAPVVFMSRATIQGGLDADTVRRVIRRHLPEVRHCYVTHALVANPQSAGMISVTFLIAANGSVGAAQIARATLAHAPTQACLLAAVRRWRFPRPEGASPVVSYPFHFQPGGTGRTVAAASPPAAPARPVEGVPTDPQERRIYLIERARKAGQLDAALALAVAWRTEDPGDALAYVWLGEVLRDRGEAAQAARAFGSIIDLYPARADLRRFAAGRLERLGEAGLGLAVDSYRVAVAQRPDHPAGHHQLGLALLRQGRPAEAFRTLEKALGIGFRDRYPEARRVLAETLGLVGAAWARRDPAYQAVIRARLRRHGQTLPTTPSLRFVLSWETDANDVDFHVYDRGGDHAYYSKPALDGGGALYADVTEGYGPECFTVPGQAKGFPYRLEANYYRRGPMGYGMGKVDVIQHDGKGNVKHEVRPYVVRKDGETVSLGSLDKPL
jgi:hypothetical protein